MTPRTGGEPIAKLPFQIRPIAGEGGRSFVTRLARANCLPPTYLRRFLTGGQRGIPSWDRIAAVTGRNPEQLLETLTTTKCKACGTGTPRASTFGPPPSYCSARCRVRTSRKRYTKAPCRICSKPMKIQIGQRHRLCSSACRRTAYLMRQNGGADSAAQQQSRICVACERPLPPNSHASRRTCSARCRTQAIRWRKPAEEQPPLRTTTACAFCATTIRVDDSSGPLRRWCSARCRQRAQRGLDPTVFFAPLTCEYCQARFERGPSNKPRRWCSPSCRQRAHRGLDPAALSAPLTCEYCRAHFERGATGKVRRWCSPRCYQRAHRQCEEPKSRMTPASKPVKIVTADCQRCKHPFQTTKLRGCSWCSLRCWNEDLERRHSQARCGICEKTLSDLMPHESRLWCSPACRCKAARWRKELRTRL